MGVMKVPISYKSVILDDSSFKMEGVCKQLLCDITSDCQKDLLHCRREYKRLCIFAERFPILKISIKKDIGEIENQWVSIVKLIMSKTKGDLLIPSLFAVTKQIMEEYHEVDKSIPKHHAVWLEAVITEIENRKSSFPYFLVGTFIIFCLCRTNL